MATLRTGPSGGATLRAWKPPDDDEASRRALQAMSDAVLAVAAELAVEPILQKLVHAARDLAGARYAAPGIPDGEGASRGSSRPG